MKVYVLDEDQWRRLLGIEQALYGDGTVMSEDRRRDLANALNGLTHEIRTQVWDVEALRLEAPKSP